jgi:hypothetical protein
MERLQGLWPIRAMEKEERAALSFCPMQSMHFVQTYHFSIHLNLTVTLKMDIACSSKTLEQTDYLHYLNCIHFAQVAKLFQAPCILEYTELLCIRLHVQISTDTKAEIFEGSHSIKVCKTGNLAISNKRTTSLFFHQTTQKWHSLLVYRKFSTFSSPER